MIPALPRSDLRHLSAAIAWIELGDHLGADKELDQITARLRAHPDVLAVRWQVYAKAGNWGACVDIADAVIKPEPDRVAAWTDRATALAKAQNLEAAHDSLLAALDQLPAE